MLGTTNKLPCVVGVVSRLVSVDKERWGSKHGRRRRWRLKRKREAMLGTTNKLPCVVGVVSRLVSVDKVPVGFVYLHTYILQVQNN